MDAYSEILNHMRNQGAKYNPPAVQIGEMINSITLKLGDLQIDKDNLLIADYLLNGYTRQISVNNGTPNTYKTEDTLRAGDLVAVISTEDRQSYIVLAKVAKL